MLRILSHKLRTRFLGLLLLVLTGFVFDAVNVTDLIPDADSYHGEAGFDFDDSGLGMPVEIYGGGILQNTIKYFLPDIHRNDNQGKLVFVDQDSPSLEVEYAGQSVTQNIVAGGETVTCHQLVYQLPLYLMNRSLLI
jgi:hypothetical protein